MKKDKYHHGNLKQELLDIAFEFIKNEGASGLTLKILADATGTSRSAIYRHFNSKDDLMETILATGFEQFDDYISLVLKDRKRPLVDRFYLCGISVLRYAKQNPNLYRLLFGKKYADIRDRVIDIKSEDCSGFGALRSAIKEGQQDGIVEKSDSYKKSIIIWASIHGLASLMIDGFMDVDKLHEELYDDMFKSLLSGIVTKKAKVLLSMPFSNKIYKTSYLQ